MDRVVYATIRGYIPRRRVSPPFSSTKLHCLVMVAEAHVCVCVCEQLAQGRYMKVVRPLDRESNALTITPPCHRY